MSTLAVFICVGVCAAISLISLSISIWAASKTSGVCSAQWKEQVDEELMTFRQQASTLSSCQCIGTGIDSTNTGSEAVTDSGVNVVPETNTFGAVSISINGEAQTKYVLFPEWARQFVHVNATSITLQGGGRVYIGDSPSDTIMTELFYQMPLLGKRLTLDVDLSRVGCNCNGALYFVSMPAHNSAQQPAPGEHGDYYCDANAVGGTYCPEMDVLEANKHAMSSTAHTCEYVAPRYYPSCDGAGCGTNILDVDINAYGPGKQINTNKPFTLSTSFIQGENNLLSTVTNTFSQASQSFEFNACNPDYLQWMGYSLPGIVMTMSLWGTGPGGLAWLDGRSECQGGCNLEESSVTFSNFRLDDL